MIYATVIDPLATGLVYLLFAVPLALMGIAATKRLVISALIASLIADVQEADKLSVFAVQARCPGVAPAVTGRSRCLKTNVPLHESQWHVWL